jgi:hypothetical protein
VVVVPPGLKTDGGERAPTTTPSMLNVRDFGALRDGKTDDTLAYKNGAPGTATPSAATTTSAQNHLTVMSFYGFDAPKMQGWVNLGMEGEGGLEAKLDAWTRYKIPSLYGKLPSSEVHGCTDAVGGIFPIGRGLC